MPQTYDNHMHHPVLTYIASVAVLAALAFIIAGWTNSRQDYALLSMLIGVQALVSISRSYTTTLQDRIIRLEMRVRAEKVLPPPQQALLARLRPKQVAALRFAGDEELGALVERASAEDLSPKAIKKAITNWQPDYLRT
jgi:predicted phage-related endonuclease